MDCRVARSLGCLLAGESERAVACVFVFRSLRPLVVVVGCNVIIVIATTSQSVSQLASSIQVDQTQLDKQTIGVSSSQSQSYV